MSAPSQNPPPDDVADTHDSDELLDADEAGEEIMPDEDTLMDDGEDDDNNEIVGEIDLQNDSVAHFDLHSDSLFAIAAHPLDPSLVATGSGDDSIYVFRATGTAPLLPSSYESNPQPRGERQSLEPLTHLTGHTDSPSALSFSLPDGKLLLSAGLDGRLRAYAVPTDLSSKEYKFIGEAQEVEEINWLAACPHPNYPNTFAFGANDGSVWVYTVDAESPEKLTIVQTFYQHTASSTAGTWSPSGSLLASVSEEGSLYVYDPFADAAAAGVTSTAGQAVVGLTMEDQRFAVQGGLFSVAIAPSGAFLACGGAEGMIRIVGLPLVSSNNAVQATKSQKGAGSKSKAGGGKQSGAASSGQAGQILASLQAQGDGVETLSFSQPPLTLLAAGSVDGSVALFDHAHRFAVRRHIREAHNEEAVVQVEFVKPEGATNEGWVLTTAGMDGVVRRWDTRGGTAAAANGLMQELKGHRGGGEGGGVMGFVQGGGKIVTAGDDGVSLVFDVGAA
jgi:ribosome assembly protein SQT1